MSAGVSNKYGIKKKARVKVYDQFSKVNLVFFFNDVQKEHSD